MDRAVRILVVEDEFMIAEDISMRLSDFGYQVVGIAPSADAAIDLLEKNTVDLALLDVNIEGDKDGIELAGEIAKKYQIPFIFLTSLAGKSIVERAKDTRPSAYLLKPFNDRQVQIAIDMALLNFSNNAVASVSENGAAKAESKQAVISMTNSLFLKKETHFVRVHFDEIIYLTAESNYTVIITSSVKYMYTSVLKNFEERLPNNTFVRVHRSYIVNVNKISGFEGNYIFLGDVKIPVSKHNREELFKLFKVL